LHFRQGIFDREASRQARALHAAITTAKDQTDEVRDQIATRVAKLYLAAGNAASAINLAKARVESAEATFRDLTDRNAQGKALDIDVSHARMRVESEQQLLMQAQSDRARAELDLLDALNLPLDTPLTLTDSLAFTPPDTMSPAQAVAIALKSRAEIVTQKQRLEADRLSNSSIQAERLPTLFAFANGGSLGTSVPSSVGTYDVGLSLNVPIFDGGRRASRGAQTVAAVRQSEIRQRQLEKQVELEVRQALLKLDTARARVDISSKQFAIAQEELDHRRRRSEQGVEQEAVVTDARLALAQADDARLAALYAWDEARIELMQAMGTIRSLAQ
jgi:outer membrane protein TolC